MSHFGPAVSHATAKDPLLRMRAYQVAADLLEAAWHDAKKLNADRARFFEYALSSARESISWYQGARPVLGDVVPDRLEQPRGNQAPLNRNYPARARGRHPPHERVAATGEPNSAGPQSAILN